jgi:hypothetical protein
LAGIGDGEVATEASKRASGGLIKLETSLRRPSGADVVSRRRRTAA